MTIIFFTDPHIGLNRVANTTPASRVKLKSILAEQVFNILGASNTDKKVCAGDLFDTYSNDEAALVDGYSILSEIDVCLAGNHDCNNRRDSISSLQFLETVTDDKVWVTPFGQAGFQWKVLSDTAVCGIPHVASQELFEQSLQMALDKQPVCIPKMPCVLLLHCNYESPFAEAETTLNLSEAWATKLLEVYDYVILGHEHQPRDLFGGRLVILGNTHPTGFADISDKRTATLDAGKLTFTTVWSASEGYLCCDHTAVPTGDCGRQFVRLTGSIDAANVGTLSKAVTALWKNSPGLLAVKIDVEVNQVQGKDGEKIEIEALPATIRRDLEGSDMAELFEELLEKAS